MSYSYVQYTGNGTLANYTFPFQYLSADHIKVKVDGVIAIFSLLNANTVTITPTPALNSIIEIRRVTPKDNNIVNFTDGSVLLERDLDLLATFDLYIAQEAADAVEDTISKDALGRWDGQALRLGNIAPAITADEVVIKGSLDYEYPAVALVASERSNISIVGSDLGASTTGNSDLGSITDPVDTTPAEGTSRIVVVATNIDDVNLVADNIASVQAAIPSASAAAASATAAAASATNAATSATSASTSASAASTSKDAAAASATSAGNYATAAAGSSATASTQASAASGSASAAATSASNAGASATNAQSSATSAASSATSATNSASSASTSAANAASSESSAASSASSAATSATTASSAQAAVAANATAAANSATAAAGSATTASTAATTATTQATNAANSATSAGTSATNAAASASASSTSATSAAASAASTAALLDSFDDRYLGPKASAPTLDNDGNALVVGALYFDTTSGKMRVYTATGWIDASSASQAALTVYRYTATAGQTTFSGADSNSLTLAYLAGGIVVSLNGSVLVGGAVDYTATNGTSIVLGVGATVGDVLEVYAFASFSIASLNGSAIVDSTVTVDKLTNIIDLGVLP